MWECDFNLLVRPRVNISLGGSRLFMHSHYDLITYLKTKTKLKNNTNTNTNTNSKAATTTTIWQKSASPRPKLI